MPPLEPTDEELKQIQDEWEALQAREEAIAEIELEEEVEVEVCIPEAYPTDDGGEEYDDAEGEYD